jgi:hypothetical protein
LTLTAARAVGFAACLGAERSGLLVDLGFDFRVRAPCTFGRFTACSEVDFFGAAGAAGAARLVASVGFAEPGTSSSVSDRIATSATTAEPKTAVARRCLANGGQDRRPETFGAGPASTASAGVTSTRCRASATAGSTQGGSGNAVRA